MKKKLLKALALAMAAVTVIGGVSPTVVSAAVTYETAKILSTDYEVYGQLNNNISYFVDMETTEIDGEVKNVGVNAIVLVDGEGKTTSLKVKEDNGALKYVSVKRADIDGLKLEKSDGTYELYYADGTWVGNGDVAYKNIKNLYDGHFIVSNDTVCNVIDAKGNVVKENFMYPCEADYISWNSQVYGDYYLITRFTPNSSEAWLYDKDFNAVESDDLYLIDPVVIDDKLVSVLPGAGVLVYDETLKQDPDFKIKVEAVEGLATSAIGTEIEVVTDYATGRDLLGVYVYIVRYDIDKDEETESYEWHYYDMTTYEKVEEEDILFYNLYKEPIYSTDGLYCEVKVVDDEDIFMITKGETVVLELEDIEKWLKEQKSLARVEAPYSDVYGIDGNIVILCWGITADDTSVDYIVTIKGPDYSLETATIQEKTIEDIESYTSAGVIVYEDGTYYFGGKVHENAELFSLITGTKDGKYDAVGYTIKTVKDDVVSYTLYALDGTEMFKVEEEIIRYVGANVIVTSDGEKYGCMAVKVIKTGDDLVKDEIESAEQGGKVEVALDKEEKLSEDVLSTLKGKDVVLEVAVDDVVWTINGKNITGTDLANVDLSVKVVEDVVPAEAITALNFAGDKIQLSLGHDGEFGFTAQLKVDVDVANAGKYANRFYYNEETKELEFEEAVKVGADGSAVFTYTHASDYVIVLSDAAYEEPVVKPMGDISTTMFYVYALAAVALISGAIVIKKKYNL